MTRPALRGRTSRTKPSPNLYNCCQPAWPPGSGAAAAATPARHPAPPGCRRPLPHIRRRRRRRRTCSPRRSGRRRGGAGRARRRWRSSWPAHTRRPAGGPRVCALVVVASDRALLCYSWPACMHCMHANGHVCGSEGGYRSTACYASTRRRPVVNGARPPARPAQEHLILGPHKKYRFHVHLKAVVHTC